MVAMRLKCFVLHDAVGCVEGFDVSGVGEGVGRCVCVGGWGGGGELLSKQVSE